MAAFDRVDADLFQRVGEVGQLFVAVELAAMGKAARPGEDRGDRIGRGFLTLLMLAVVTGHRAVGGFGFDRLAVRRHEGGRGGALGGPRVRQQNLCGSVKGPSAGPLPVLKHPQVSPPHRLAVEGAGRPEGHPAADPHDAPGALVGVGVLEPIGAQRERGRGEEGREERHGRLRGGVGGGPLHLDLVLLLWRSGAPDGIDPRGVHLPALKEAVAPDGSPAMALFPSGAVRGVLPPAHRAAACEGGGAALVLLLLVGGEGRL